jgi:hypothetical protein
VTVRSQTAVLTLGVCVLAACGGKPQSAGAPGVDTTEATAAAAAKSADSASKTALDSAAKPTTPAAASSAKNAAGSKVESGDYDRAGRPKFKIDEKTGAVTPIKRP